MRIVMDERRAGIVEVVAQDKRRVVVRFFARSKAQASAFLATQLEMAEFVEAEPAQSQAELDGLDGESVRVLDGSGGQEWGE